MQVSLRRITALLIASALVLAGFGAISSPARAADVCPFPVDDQTANDHPLATIRLVSPVLTDENSVHRTDFEETFTILCDWFGVGTRFNQVYVPFGMTTNLTYLVTNSKGAPLPFTQLKLRANKGYSSSNAHIYVNGTSVRPNTGGVSDGGIIKATTDSNGYVNFVVKSPTDCEEYGGKLPPKPVNLNSDTPHDSTEKASEDCYSQIIPQVISETVIHGEKTDTVDFVELHYFDPATLDNTVTEAQLTMAVPYLDEENSIVGESAVQAYATIGSKQTVVVQATKPDGSWARNVPVTVRINLANSGSNAKVSAGLYSDAYRGFNSPAYKVNSLATTAADLTKMTEDQLVLTGTTDAFGSVVFALNNSDTVGELPPASAISPVPTDATAKYSRITASSVGVSSNDPVFEAHYFKPAPVLPTSITATASGRTIKVTIKNAVGKTSTITITGRAKVTVKPTAATKVLSYTVKKGKITVKVVSNGKTLNKVFTIK
jgi:hypothetical protein